MNPVSGSASRFTRWTPSVALFELNIGKPRIATREDPATLEEAASAVDGNKFPLQFLTTEWEQVVDAWQLETWEGYRDVLRLAERPGSRSHSGSSSGQSLNG